MCPLDHVFEPTKPNGFKKEKRKCT